LLTRGGWAAFTVAAYVLLVLVPGMNLLLPAGHPFHLADYWVTLGGKVMCYAIVAMAMDLIWGYAGILSLGHGLFFALGGAMGMYLTRSATTASTRAICRLHGVPRLEDVPWYWATDHFWYAALLVVLVPGVLAFVFGLLRVRSGSGVFLDSSAEA
jgi:urea transport system permease protein